MAKSCLLLFWLINLIVVLLPRRLLVDVGQEVQLEVHKPHEVSVLVLRGLPQGPGHHGGGLSGARGGA